MVERGFAWRTLALATLLLSLAACAPQRSVRVAPDETTTSTVPNATAHAGQGEYVVVRGDTLYGIAFRNGMDYRELARLNGIQAPYTIYPGQRLRLGEATAVAARPAALAPAPRSDPPATPSSGIVAGVIAAPPRSGPAPAAETPPRSSVATSPTKPIDPPARPVATTTPPPASAPAPLPMGPVQWRWPAEGKLIGTFLAGDPTRQGINIGGDAGQPIHAAADGVVVYSGSGLIGYGELIIVKHSETLLSAYGHNRKRLVAEGDAVKAGQVIAEMGRSGASRDMLHFEVRSGGKPIDPLGVLPRR